MKRSTHRRSRMRLSLLTITLGSMLALPALANASSASRSGDTVNFVANPGETNILTLNVQSFTTKFTIEDTAGITPGAGCQAESATTVSCGESPALLVASLGDGNDVLRWNGDTRFGDSPAENVDAGPGDDYVDGSSAGLADILHGGDGNDHLDGGNGADQVFGDAGNDTVLGGNGDDTVSGGSGMDILYGDNLGWSAASNGSDTIDAAEGEADRVTCGLGADLVTADSLDVVEGTIDCEKVNVRTVVPGSSTPSPGRALSVGLTVARTGQLSRLLAGKFAFRAHFSQPCAVTVGLVVDAKTARRLGLGRGITVLDAETGQIPKAGTYPATASVKPRFAAKLKRARSMVAFIAIACEADGGIAKNLRKVTFRR